jgi:Cd2+/Zn2+-exporting ATPase
VAFDKTGTITNGTLHVTDVVSLNGVARRDVLRLAGTLESRSEHPIGRAIVQRAESEEIELGSVLGFQALPGLGASGQIDGASVVVGSERLFASRGMYPADAAAAVESFAREGRSSVMVGLGGEPIGVIAVSDELRATARDTVQMLRDQGIEHVVLLTGDHEVAAREMSAAAGIDDFRAGLLPEQKLDAVQSLKQKYGVLAMIGDGVNDAPALAAADVGIAMGVAGTDAALETADIALMADELPKIPYAVRLSRATTRNIRANIAFSLALKAAFLILAIAGLATLWMAVVADMGASLIVIANALRLLRE